MGRRSETIRYHRMIDAGDSPQEKPCCGCGDWLPLADFGADRSRKDGLSNLCRPCARRRYAEWMKANPDRARRIRERGRTTRDPEISREAHRKHRYGMQRGEYAALMEKQGGVCAICMNPPRIRLVVDHCHRSGRVRGLLCDRCNHALHIVERPALLKSARAYLRPPDGEHSDDSGMVEPRLLP